MRARLVVNPVSGSDSGPDVVTRLNARLRAGLGDLDIVMTAAPGDAARAGADAARQGYDLVIVGGGDGTLNEVLNGVAAIDGALARTTLGLVPLGTGNDFARVIGVPLDPDEAADVVLAGRERAVDVGVLNGRAFVNVSAGGFIAAVSETVAPALKTVAGRLAYLLGGAKALLEHEAVRARIRVAEAEPRERALDVQMFAACNARLIGGGRPIAPGAILDDGLLDFCFVEVMPVLEFVRLLRAVAEGEHLTDPRVTYVRAAEAEIAFARDIPVNTDGEVMRTARCHYTVNRRAARFLIGPDAAL